MKSDHCCPFIEIKSNSTTFHMSSFKRLLLNYNKLDTIKFENSLRTTNWEEIVTIDDLDEAALLFSNTLFDITKNCMPVKTVRIRENDAPWMTEEIRKLRSKKLKHHTLAKRLNSN